MQTDQTKSPDQAKKGYNSIFNALTLLALPWLNFQGKVLEVMKAGIQDANNIKPFKALAQHEVHALMMIVDPERKWRNSTDGDFEKKCEAAYDETVAKITSGSVSFIEAQQKLIATLIETANKGRT